MKRNKCKTALVAQERERIFIAHISTFSQTATSPQPGSRLDQFKSYQ